jgi:hypothetical protein
LYRLEGCNLAEGDEAKLWQLDCNLGHGGGRRQLCIAGGLAFCGGLKIELVGWIPAVFRIIDEKAMNAVVSSNLTNVRSGYDTRNGRAGRMSRAPMEASWNFPSAKLKTHTTQFGPQ